MKTDIFEILCEYGIDCASAISLKNCQITRQYKLEKAGFICQDKLSAIMLAVPYLTPHPKRNISAYATSRDYHVFYKSLFDKLIPRLKSEYPGYGFAGFADDSPIDERNAAAMAGLGVIGDNMMLITPKYSSYVFLGEIVTDMPIDTELHPIVGCEHCGACRSACPMSEIGTCLSALTQKKGELDEREKSHILKYGSAWGCDICQEVCPHTKKAIADKTIFTNIPFFKEANIPILTVGILDGMSDEEFALRAYSWRKRPTVRRNLELFEKADKTKT